MKKHLIKLFILLNILFLSSLVIAQNKKNTGLSDKLFFGGDFWLTVGTNSYINISPLIGYKITPRLSAGTGPIFIFQSERIRHLDSVINNFGYYSTYRLKYNTYGGRLFLTYDLIQNLNKYLPINLGSIFAHCENELMNIETIYWDQITEKYFTAGDRLWIDNLLVGGGLRQPIGRRSSLNILILWDITENKYSPHSNPIFRMGFNF